MRRQYSEKVVMNIVHFMAMAGAGILPKDEAERLLDGIPEDLQSEMISALLAARAAKKVSMIAKLSSIFPLGEILEEEPTEDD